MPRVKVSSKGQIVIPAELRVKYNLKPGTEMEVRESAGRLYLFPVLADPVEQARGILKGGRSLTEALLTSRKEALAQEDQSRSVSRGAGKEGLEVP